MRVLAVVLAGGRGHRFWPKSSAARPKQFLNLFGEESLLQATVRRLGNLLSPEDIYVVTTAAHETLVREQVPGLPEGNLITEPMGRDTAAAVGYALTLIDEEDPDSVAVVLPSDHFISGVETWVRTIRDACRAADAGHPVLIGIPPTRPETAYGYVLLSEELHPAEVSTRFYRARRFIEKPDRATVERLLADNSCLWNSGMFIWRVGTALDLIRLHLPDTFEVLDEIRRMKRAGGAPPPGSPAWRDRVAGLFGGLQPVSIDNGVLEKCTDVIIALGEFGWDDVGGWEAVARFNPCDERENVVRGNVLLKDTERCIVDWDGGPALVVGISDTVIAGSSGGLLVCSRGRLGEVKKLLGDSKQGSPGGESK